MSHGPLRRDGRLEVTPRQRHTKGPHRSATPLCGTVGLTTVRVAYHRGAARAPPNFPYRLVLADAGAASPTGTTCATGRGARRAELLRQVQVGGRADRAAAPTTGATGATQCATGTTGTTGTTRSRAGCGDLGGHNRVGGDAGGGTARTTGATGATQRATGPTGPTGPTSGGTGPSILVGRDDVLADAGGTTAPATRTAGAAHDGPRRGGPGRCRLGLHRQRRPQERNNCKDGTEAAQAEPSSLMCQTHPPVE